MVAAVRDVDLTIARYEIIAVIGPGGCGKRSG
jgi:ABC-type Fe3+/spermidine/putrescine transport system ATPase subunit